jgi:hypothetical protein
MNTASLRPADQGTQHPSALCFGTGKKYVKRGRSSVHLPLDATSG